MPKICILTFHRACNYGAVLQAYALQTALSTHKNLDVYLLDYYSKKVYDPYKALGMLKEKEDFVKNAIRTALIFPSLIKSNHSFEVFRRQYLRYVPGSQDKEGLKGVCRGYDGIVVGSDQVWNSEITGNDLTYFLNFAPNSVKKFSYAASIGRDSLSQEDLQNMRKYLRNFEGISLRESNSLSSLRCVLPGKPVRCDVDPVFLLSVEQWRNLAKDARGIHGVLCFLLRGHESVPAASFAKRLADKNGIKAVYLSSLERWFRCRNMKHYGVASPTQFLGAIDNAEYVVTDSFHGTAFSIIFHKPFFVETNIARSGRIKNLLELSGLTDRALINGVPQREPKPIDWDVVDARMAKHIESSKRYLKEIADSLES